MTGLAHPGACAIGLDVGGTKIAGGVIALDSGQILVQRTIPTLAQRGGEAVLDDALALANTLCAEAEQLGKAVGSIGVGVPELVDLNGAITSGHAVAWRGVPVQSRFGQLRPAVVEADVRAHALAEAVYGAGRAYRLFAFITVGTGISYCMVQDGVPFAGARGNALILASSPITTLCTTCGTRLEPILEEYAAGPALVARYNQATGASLERGEQVLAAVGAHDPAAIEVVQSAGCALGVSIGWLVNVLDPEAVIIGGGLGSAGGLYWESMVASARAHIWSDQSRELPVIPAALGPEAGMIGAAAVSSRVKQRV